jgi:tetratricopeptide (TPR) repeat protein
MRTLFSVVVVALVTAAGALAQTTPPAPAKQAAPAAQPAAPVQTLDEMITQYRANRSDGALLERIVVRVAKMRTKPAIPEEARRAFVQGNAAFTSAQGAADYQRAADRFTEASTLVPWWGDVYFNLSKVREQQGDFERAIRNLKLYIASAPSAADARTAQDQIYVLEEKKAAAAQRRTDEAARAARESADREASVWAAIDGARYVCPTQSLFSTQYGAVFGQMSVTVSGRTIRQQLRTFGPGVRRGGGESSMPVTTPRVTGISGAEILIDGRGERIGPSSALVEGVASSNRAAPMMTCPRQ